MLYSHMSIVRSVANSFEMKLWIDRFQRNAICIIPISVPKKSINRNCSYVRQTFPIKAKIILTSK